MTAVFNAEFSEALMLIILLLDLRPTRLKVKSSVQWPQLVSGITQEDVCCSTPCDATVLQPQTCCVCACRKAGVKTCIIWDNCSSLPLGLERLRLSNIHIIEKIASANPFIFGHPVWPVFSGQYRDRTPGLDAPGHSYGESSVGVAAAGDSPW